MLGKIDICLSPSTLLQQKYQRLDGLNNKHLFLTIPEAGKSTTIAPTDLVSGESLFPSS